MSLSEAAEAVIARAERDQIAYFDLQFTDITGMVKMVQIPTRQLAAAFEHGVWFDGSALEGFARIAESDMFLRPDPATYAVQAWASRTERVARLICDVYTPTGEPYSGDPRGVLQSRCRERSGARLSLRPRA
jgi:glutamine synthetase